MGEETSRRHACVIGITDHAQGALGDLVFVEVPKAGRKLAANEACAVVESVKAASDVYAPIAGEVLEANPALANTPEILNQDPYGDGWMWKLKPANAADVDALLDAAGYQKILATLKSEDPPCRSFRTPKPMSRTCSPRIGAPCIEALFDEIPQNLRCGKLNEVPEGLPEMEIARLMRARAAQDGALAELHRRRRLRAPHSGGGVGDHHARRVLLGLYAVPGRGEPGHAAGALRIPDA